MDTVPSAVATAGKLAGSPVLEAYPEHSAIPAGSPPLCQSGEPLAAASSSKRGRSWEGPNLVSKVDAEVLQCLFGRETHALRELGERVD